jgi:hypothetical protein
VVNWGQKILDDVILPILHGSVSFHLLCFEIHVFNVHARVIAKVAEGYLYEFFCKKVFGNVLRRIVHHILHRGLSAHRCLTHVGRCLRLNREVIVLRVVAVGYVDVVSRCLIFD